MSGVKNNLADIQRRTKDLTAHASPSPTVSHQTNHQTVTGSKFKPPKTASSSGSVRQPHTGYLSFSTPGFRCPRENSATSTPDTSNSSSSSSLLPSKRSLADPSIPSASSIASLKRTKLNHSDDKENLFESNLNLSTQTSSASSVPHIREALLPPGNSIDTIDVDNDLPQSAAAAAELQADTVEELHQRLQENRRLRNFIEEMLSEGCQDEENLRNQLDLCLDRIRNVEGEQRARRQRVPYQGIAQRVDVSQRAMNPEPASEPTTLPTTPSRPCPRQVTLPTPPPHADDTSVILVSNSDEDDDDDHWRRFSDIPDVDFVNFPDENVVAAPLAPTSAVLNSSYKAEALRVLNNVFSLPSFRKHQLEAIDATMDGKDVFVLMPTGGGKSMCYQVPAICTSGKTKGVTLVISPLIALMTDQVESLKKKGVDAVSITSNTAHQQYWQIHDRLLGPGRKPAMVYVAPERFHNDSLNSWMKPLHSSGQLARFVIDEAHCISTWGRDFRDAYKDLGRLRQNYPGVPIMALTATANLQVRDDVINRLGIKGCLLLQQSFNRPNLNYEVRRKTNKIIDDMAAWIKKNHTRQTGVIYARTKLDCEKVAQELREQYGLSAEYYHADIDSVTKDQKLNSWLDGTIKIMVATIAFGMGIDKANVRFVIHHTLPQSFDSYYQETGRAGRDGRPADCILYFRHDDAVKLSKLIEKGEIAQSEKQRQLDGLKEVERFCFNDTDCRRKQLLQHFDQAFDPKDCRGLCDVCAKDETVVEEDVTGLALDILNLTADLTSGGNRNVSKTVVMSVYRGSRIKAVISKGYDANPRFGAGKSISNDKVDRLFHHLIFEKGLKQESVSTGGEWSSLYMKLGDNADQFLSGRPVKMKFKVGSDRIGQRAPVRSRSQKIKSQASVTARTAKCTAIGIEDLGDLYVDDIDDGELNPADDIEMTPAPRPQLSSKKKPKSESLTPSGEDASSHCLSELRNERSQIAEEHGYDDPEALVGDEALQMLSLMGAEDMDQLKGVLAECDVNQKKVIKLCGTRFLVVCQKYHFQKLQARENSSARLHERYDFHRHTS